MRRFTADGLCLYQGDALQILPTLPAESVDAVVTDPPYCSGGATAAQRQRDPSSKYQMDGQCRKYPPMLGDGMDQRSFTYWCADWLSECWCLARPGAPCLVFTDWRQLPAMSDAVQVSGWIWRGVVVWDKGNDARPNRGRFRQQCEFVLFATKGAFKGEPDVFLPGMFSYISDRTKSRVHLCGKPVGLMRDLLGVVCPGGTVLDPFMGSGSTGAACLETGRKFLGVERSQEYFNLCCKRLGGEA